jgi:hypothetical protein
MDKSNLLSWLMIILSLLTFVIIMVIVKACVTFTQNFKQDREHFPALVSSEDQAQVMQKIIEDNKSSDDF